MEDTRSRWDRAFKEAVEFDSWGQVEEAVEGYSRLQVAASAEYVENILQLPMHRRIGIGKLAAVLRLRVQELRQSQDRHVGLTTMKTLQPYMKSLIVSDVPFPINNIDADGVLGVSPNDDVPTVPQGRTQPSTGPKVINLVDAHSAPSDGSLKGPTTSVSRGDVTLTISIEKWGFKDAPVYVEPRVVVTVCDSKGHTLEPPQETPLAKSAGASYVFFDSKVHLQTPLNRLPRDAAIFLEFKHWKAKKQKRSCKAYCYMELEEIRNGPLTLEVYKKPVDFLRKKKPSLLTVKPLYLHLDLSLEKH